MGGGCPPSQSNASRAGSRPQRFAPPASRASCLSVLLGGALAHAPGPPVPGQLASMISLAVFIDDVADHRLSAKRVAVVFRPKDYPSVLIEPGSSSARLKAGWPVTFGRGKSCLMPWPSTELSSVELQFYLVDQLEQPAVTPTSEPPEQQGLLLGSGRLALDLCDAVSGFAPLTVRLHDLVGNEVATLRARCKAAPLGGTLVQHVQPQQIVVGARPSSAEEPAAPSVPHDEGGVEGGTARDALGSPPQQQPPPPPPAAAAATATVLPGDPPGPPPPPPPPQPGPGQVGRPPQPPPAVGTWLPAGTKDPMKATTRGKTLMPGVRPFQHGASQGAASRDSAVDSADASDAPAPADASPGVSEAAAAAAAQSSSPLAAADPAPAPGPPPAPPPPLHTPRLPPALFFHNRGREYEPSAPVVGPAVRGRAHLLWTARRGWHSISARLA